MPGLHQVSESRPARRCRSPRPRACQPPPGRHRQHSTREQHARHLHRLTRTGPSAEVLDFEESVDRELNIRSASDLRLSIRRNLRCRRHYSERREFLGCARMDRNVRAMADTDERLPRPLERGTETLSRRSQEAVPRRDTTRGRSLSCGMHALEGGEQVDFQQA